MPQQLEGQGPRPHCNCYPVTYGYWYSCGQEACPPLHLQWWSPQTLQHQIQQRHQQDPSSLCPAPLPPPWQQNLQLGITDAREDAHRPGDNSGSGRSKAVRAPEPQEHQSQRATAPSKDWEVPTLKYHQGQLKLRETKTLRYGATYLKTKERTVNF